MASGTNLSGMMWTPILTLWQGTFGFHSSLCKAVYVKKKHWLSSISQHHAAICRSNVTQNLISHSTVFNRMEDAPSISPSLFLCLPCFPTLSFSDSLTFALKCFQLLQSMCSLPYILSFSSSPTLLLPHVPPLSQAFECILILTLILFLPAQSSLSSCVCPFLSSLYLTPI